jgi:hypothetical protein
MAADVGPGLGYRSECELQSGWDIGWTMSCHLGCDPGKTSDAR